MKEAAHALARANRVAVLPKERQALKQAVAKAAPTEAVLPAEKPAPVKALPKQEEELAPPVLAPQPEKAVRPRVPLPKAEAEEPTKYKV